MKWEIYVTAVELCVNSKKCYVTNTLSQPMEEVRNTKTKEK